MHIFLVNEFAVYGLRAFAGCGYNVTEAFFSEIVEKMHQCIKLSNHLLQETGPNYKTS